MKVAVAIVLSAEEKEEVEKLARGRKVAVRVAERARIVLLAAEGKQNREIAEICEVTRRTVGVWRRRFAEKGISGIVKDAPRPGHRRSIGEEVTGEIVRKTTQETPAAATHWSTQSGQGDGAQPEYDWSGLEEARLEAALGSNLQVEPGSEVRGEIGRCRGSLLESARTCLGVLCR